MAWSIWSASSLGSLTVTQSESAMVVSLLIHACLESHLGITNTNHSNAYTKSKELPQFYTTKFKSLLFTDES